MASRKTYFGIGLPKDPTDPDPAAPVDPDDRSSPTVVDDEKVAESLKQLRSWYQQASSEDDTRPVAVAPVVAPVNVAVMNTGLPQARPTAVGHATGEAPSQPQRPIAPDPMRATMFGHDIHRFDLELQRAAAEASSAVAEAFAASDSAAPKLSDNWPRPAETRSRPPAPPPADPWAAEPLRFAEHLRRPQGQQHPHAAWVSAPDDTDVHGATSRVPIAARVVFGVGVAALAAAIGLWLVSRDSDDAGSGTAPATAVPLTTGIDQPPTPPTPAPPSVLERPGAVTPERSSDGINLGAPATVSRRPTALPRAAVLPTAPMKPKRRAIPIENDEQADNEDDTTSAPQGSSGEPSTAGRAGSTDGGRAAGSADGGRPAIPGDGERAAAPARPREASRPAKSTNTKPRNKSGFAGDADATLPPSTD